MNRCAERYNHILFESMCTFAQATNIAEHAWIETILATIYVRACILCTSIDAIPFEQWYKHKLSIKCLKHFRCAAFFHSPKEKCNKFQF